MANGNGAAAGTAPAPAAELDPMARLEAGKQPAFVAASTQPAQVEEKNAEQVGGNDEDDEDLM